MASFSDSIEKSIFSAVVSQIRDKFASIRHPETGEFATVVVTGHDLATLRCHVEGSLELLELVKQRMSPEDKNIVSMTATRKQPFVFLSFTWADKELAEKIATALRARGVETWWAQWEIGHGDSIRQKIDEGLIDCTHFVVLMTPNSIDKEWVKAEMDAGFVKKIEGTAKFIPLRVGLAHSSLPPLLSGMLSPEINGLSPDITELADGIQGISSKPPLGSSPAALSLPSTGYSPAANAVAKFCVENGKNGMFGDLMLQPEDLARALVLSQEAVRDALYELRSTIKDMGHNRFMPQSAFFAEFDGYFTSWKPKDDAVVLASRLYSDTSFPREAAKAAAVLGWEPRRFNSAVSYLNVRGAIRDTAFLSSVPYVTSLLHPNDDTRRFAQSRS